MSKKAIILSALLAVALLLAVFWLGMRSGQKYAEQASPTGQMPSAGGGAMSPMPALNGAPSLPFNQPPPWAAANSGQSPMQDGKANQRQIKLAELSAMRMALMKSMQETGHVDPKQVDALLVKIESVTGTTTFNGINLEALRNTLAKSQEMQTIANEMNREASKPGGADPKKIKAYSDQLLVLQKQVSGTPFLQPRATAGPAK
jgi:hypothetical protein